MTKEQYLELRNGLYTTAEGLINKGKLEEGKAKMQEITDLDNKFDNETKAMANLNAMKDNYRVTDITALSNNAVTGKVIDKIENVTEPIIENAEPNEYVNAWAKDMLGLKLDNNEKEAFNFVNDYTHTTGNTGIVIPETVIAGIWKEVGEQYPLWNDVLKTHAKGKVTLLKSTDSTEAKWYDEATKLEDGKEVFAGATLNGCELGRAITVSWKLKEMAIEDFVPFIQSQLSEKMGAALGYAVAHGKGTPGESDQWKEEPMGIITELGKAGNEGQIATYTDKPTYENITSVMAKVKGSYKTGACFYANGTTIWNKLANVLDGNGRPYFVANPIDGGVGTIFGKPVKEDDGLLDDEVLFGNANRGYHANINKEVLLDSEDHKKERITDYIAYGIVDGGVRSTNAFSMLKKA